MQGKPMPKKALIVDNDFFFVEFFSDLREKRGYRVFKAYDGKEGIARMEERVMDFMFVDLVMPKIDGPRLIRFTRKKYPDCPFPIVAVSGAIIEHLDELQEIGADFYIAKGPLDKLTDQLNSFMNQIELASNPLKMDRNLWVPGVIYPRREAVELIDALQYQRGILDSAGVGILIIDTDTRILNVNPPACEILGRPENELYNQRVGGILDSDDSIRIVDALRKLVQQRELRKIAFTGEILSRKVRIISSLLRVGGKYAGWIVVLEEIDWDEGYC
jgi:PAS domain S-box-containing protein